MPFYQKIRKNRFLVLLLLLVFILSWSHEAAAGELRLSWTDNSNTEDGFKIERKTGTSGTYTEIAAPGANVTSYTDLSLLDGTTYCYRVRAYNSAGNSLYAPEVCGAARSTVQTFRLVVTKAGTGLGNVTSTDGAINCGGTCSKTYASGTVVQLSASPQVGSVFVGWSGTGCSSTGSTTMVADHTCTATFNLQPTATTYSITVTKAGAGSGIVTSADGAINCGSICSKLYNSGSSVNLSAIPATGSIFAGWSGCCLSNSTTLNVTLSNNTEVTATFVSQSQPAPTSDVENKTKIGVYRPETGQWFLDNNGNSHWDGCEVDICIRTFGQAGNLPVVGKWTGDGKSNIGVFDPKTGGWQLDTNGNRVWEGCELDTCVTAFGRAPDLPVTRELNELNTSIIGTFTPWVTMRNDRRTRTIRGLWNFDINGNANFDGCRIDECDTFGDVDQLPIVGDWNGTGSQEIGLFMPRYGKWYLDLNGNGTWDGCRTDRCLGSFGTAGDRPVVGDWDGTGRVRVGVFRPSTGMWYFDINGNGKFDDCRVDLCSGPFGEEGDLAVVGKW